jgi:hypothetical protein
MIIITKAKGAGNMAQVLECVLSKHKTWVPTPILQKTKQKKKETLNCKNDTTKIISVC